MIKYLQEKSYKVSQGIACAVLVCLGVGLLLQTIGNLTDWLWLQKIGFASKSLFTAALGLSIAIILKTNTMLVLCSGAASLIGGGAISVSDTNVFAIQQGEPIGAIIAALAAIWIGKKIEGKTNFDMILTPTISLLIGGIVGLLCAEIITPVLIKISLLINISIAKTPLLSSSIIALLFALLILSPASSAALSIAFALDPTASAAALIGCSVQFTAFAFLGIKENSRGAFWSQLICTPKLQTPNIIKAPRTMIIPLILSTIMAPIGILVFGITSTNEVAGLGLCALVAPLYMLSSQGFVMLLQFTVVSVVVPAIICILIRPIALKKGWIKKDELIVKLN